ncbi:hypothetical protein OUZ56_025285 [Daphnia magna]|uniref:Uncharacterized protein n=1 Tax=Daphnia magna TaxID=35525 RepID=A0ABQ9ZJE0_9CRUS|nr:hypothetical protein OUZ56_025285 [Daphnia magna]
MPGQDGVVRTAIVQTQYGEYVRPAIKLFVFQVISDPRRFHLVERGRDVTTVARRPTDSNGLLQESIKYGNPFNNKLIK